MATTDVTVILPIHELDDNSREYLAKSISSIAQQQVIPEKVLIVLPKNGEVSKEISDYDFGDIKNIVEVVENDGDTDFCSQVNFATSKVDTTYFSVLELDDEYSTIWFKNFEIYKNAHPTVDMFLPIVVDVNVDGTFLHFSNEPVWAPDFSDKLGELDNGVLQRFPNIQISGLTIKKETFESNGGFKSNIKLYFGYEFLLRLTHNDVKIMTIPRMGYKKTNMRPGSLFYNYYNGDSKISPIEARFWYDSAKKEYFFTNQRELTYTETM